jgi:hypothetical protein
MMAFEKCSICGEYDFVDRHVCPPTYYFKHPDWGDEFETIRAYSFENAAEKFAEKYFEDEPIDDNCNVEVLISDGKTNKMFRASASIDIYYDAREISMPDVEDL